MRKICYVTGTRADYGLMRDALSEIRLHKNLDLQIIVTGMHLLEEYGNTWKEIEKDGFKIASKIHVSLSGKSGLEMSLALSEEISGIAKSLDTIKPDMVLLLGDRGEALAAAIAAIHLNIPITHIHGGESSGSIDNSVRHAISKLAHFHLTSTEESKDRLIRMGELEEYIEVIGAPGLDSILKMGTQDRTKLFLKYQLDPSKPLMVMLFHSVLQEECESGNQAMELLEAILQDGTQCLVLKPNSDSGGANIGSVIDQYSDESNIVVKKHVPRTDFLDLVRAAEVFVGNSSSGIIESASLNTPVVNIGNRQHNREQNENVINVDCNTSDIVEAITKARKINGQSWLNIYGEGDASEKIINFLITVKLNDTVLEQSSAY
jgi:GDP/UDP-N,N'-diacetylbacillosamine 2-epimerase (hydrolysing)